MTSSDGNTKQQKNSALSRALLRTIRLSLITFLVLSCILFAVRQAFIHLTRPKIYSLGNWSTDGRHWLYEVDLRAGFHFPMGWKVVSPLGNGAELTLRDTNREIYQVLMSSRKGDDTTTPAGALAEDTQRLIATGMYTNGGLEVLGDFGILHLTANTPTMPEASAVVRLLRDSNGQVYVLRSLVYRLDSDSTVTLNRLVLYTTPEMSERHGIGQKSE